MKIKLESAFVAVCVLAGCATTTVDNSTVASIDLDLYLGEWYEIARFDHSFERGVEQAKATYTKRPDGKIDVVNSGVKDGKRKMANGIAKVTDTPGLLRVTFFWPFYGDYRVMYLAPDYSCALVGSGDSEYLWLLSRKPALADADKATLLAEATRRGYDVSRLIWVRQ